MKKNIKLENLDSKTIIRCYGKDSNGIPIDFSENLIHISVCFNNSKIHTYDDFIEIIIQKNNKPQKIVCDLSIINNSNSANIILSTSIHDFNLDSIKVVAL